MRVHIFSLLTSLFSLASQATPAGENLRTEQWGRVWDTGVFPDSVEDCDTPGNDFFTGYRVTAPAYYAFLDGFDTRAFAHDDEETESCTNLPTFRFFYTSNIASRVSSLARLACGTNEGTFWSSTRFDGFSTNNLPPVQPFNWTTNIGEKIFAPYPSPLTRWLPTFKAMGVSGSAITGVVYKANVRYPRGLFWYEILPLISVGDPATYAWVQRSPLDYSLPPFDNLYEDVFGIAPNVTNRPFSARLAVPTMGQSDRVLALFDRTVRVNPDVVAYTNSISATGHVKHSRRATLPTLYITIQGDGSATIDTARTPPTIATVGAVVSTNYVDAMDWPCELSSPRLRVGRPTLAATASFSVETNSIAVSLEGLAFLEFCDALYQEGDPQAKQVSFAASLSQDGSIYLEASAYAEGTATRYNSTTLHIPQYESGYFDVGEGRVAVSASYGYGVTDTRHRLPYGVADWPANPDGAETAREFTFASFISTNDYCGWSTPITYGDGAEYGYRAFIGTRDVESGDPRFPILYSALQSVEDKCAVGDAANPQTWTGLYAGDLSTAILNFNTNAAANISASVRTRVIGDGGFWDGTGTIYQNSYGYSIHTDDGTVYDNDIPVAIRAIVLSVTLPTVGITIRDEAKSVDTHVKCATEANWNFPQLTIKQP